MSLKDIKRWYYVKQGIKRGPVSVEELGRMIEEGDLPPEEVRVWREGSVDWMPITKVKVFRKNLLRAGWSFDEPKQLDEDLVHRETDLLCMGLNRIGYNVLFYLGMIGVPVLVSIGMVEARVAGWLDYEGIENTYWWQYMPIAVFVVALLIATMSRMKNAGYGAPSGLGLLIPVLNIGVLVMALCAPKNYLRRKNLGLSGVIYFIVFCVWVVGGVFAFTGGYLNKVEKIFHDAPGYFWEARNAGPRYIAHKNEERLRADRVKREKQAKDKKEQSRMKRNTVEE